MGVKKVMRTKLERYLKLQGFNQSTLNLLNNDNLAKLAAEYFYKK